MSKSKNKRIQELTAQVEELRAKIAASAQQNPQTQNNQIGDPEVEKLRREVEKSELRARIAACNADAEDANQRRKAARAKSGWKTLKTIAVAAASTVGVLGVGSVSLSHFNREKPSAAQIAGEGLSEKDLHERVNNIPSEDLVDFASFFENGWKYRKMIIEEAIKEKKKTGKDSSNIKALVETFNKEFAGKGREGNRCPSSDVICKLGLEYEKLRELAASPEEINRTLFEMLAQERTNKNQSLLRVIEKGSKAGVPQPQRQNDGR